MKTLREMAQTGTEIQIWIEVRLCNSTDGSVEGTLLVVSYQGPRTLVPMIGYQIRTSPRLSGSVAVVVLRHAALAFAALDRTCSSEVFRRRRDEFVVQALMVPLAVIVGDVFQVQNPPALD